MKRKEYLNELMSVTDALENAYAEVSNAVSAIVEYKKLSPQQRELLDAITKAGEQLEGFSSQFSFEFSEDLEAAEQQD